MGEINDIFSYQALYQTNGLFPIKRLFDIRVLDKNTGIYLWSNRERGELDPLRPETIPKEKRSGISDTLDMPSLCHLGVCE